MVSLFFSHPIRLPRKDFGRGAISNAIFGVMRDCIFSFLSLMLCRRVWGIEPMIRYVIEV